ncbi:uncharacterized protein LOC122263302 isoform X2 [Penaeus japonicus]|uniref:uncharacterized protein LOC122263302 isoform X2 n=1 Tax=Penaeus japonicus TaxID=27405 RepID=UPI001C70C3C7|nr:uncharacterized protein LOC122263302 isoform X2 [Penaeus japonicus]
MADKNWPVTRIPSIFDSDDDSDEDLSNPTPSTVVTSQVPSKASTAFSEEYPAHSQANNEQDTVKEDCDGEDAEKEGSVEQEPETFVSCEQESKEVDDEKQTSLEDQGGLQATDIVKSNEQDHEEESREGGNLEKVDSAEKVEGKEEEIDKVAPSVKEADEGQSSCADLDKSSPNPGGSDNKEGIDEELDKSFSSFDNVEGSDSDDINKGNQSISSHDNMDDGSEEDAARDDKSISSHDNLDEASEGEDAEMEVDKSTASHDNVGDVSEEDIGDVANKSFSSHDQADEASEDADMEVDKSMSSHSNADEVSEEDEGESAMNKSSSSHDNVEIGSDDNDDKKDTVMGDKELDISLSSHGNADNQSDGDINDSHLGYVSEEEKDAGLDVDAEKEKFANVSKDDKVSDRIDSPTDDDSKSLLEKEQSVSDSEEKPVEIKSEDDSAQVENNDVVTLSKEEKIESGSQMCSHTSGDGNEEVVTEKEEKDIEAEKIDSTIDIQEDIKSPISKDEASLTEVQEAMETEKDSDLLDKEKVPSHDEMESGQLESVPQTTFKTEQNNICEPLDTKDNLEDQKIEKGTTEMEKKEEKSVEESPKWDASTEDSEFESRDSDAQEPVSVNKLDESIYSDSETEDMDMEAENEPKVAVTTSSIGRVPVRVEDVYTDSEDEGTRDSQPQVGSKGCETSVTSETDSVDPEEQKDNQFVPSRAQEGRAGTPQLSVIEALPPSHTKEDTKASVTPPSPEKKRHHKRRHESKKSFNLEACLKAFEQGWKREIVFRATVDPNKGGSRADIYYYAPFGKKLRSKVEIEDYLQRYGIQDLNLDNFTWVKAPLGVGEQYEQIRHASKSSTNTVRGKTSTPSQAGVATPTITPVSSPKTPSSAEVKNPRKRGRPPKQLAEKPPKRARMKITPIIPLKLKKQLDNSKNITPVPAGVTETSISESQETFPTNWNSSADDTTTQLGEEAPAKGAVSSKSRQNHIVYSTKVCESLGASTKILTPMLSGDICMRTFHCTNFCPLGGGTVPGLQCIKCLCLFHQECTYMPPATVTIIQTGGAKFLCPNCYRENKENVSTNQWTPPKPYEPLAYDPPSWESEEEEDNKPDQEATAQNYVRVSIKDPLSVLPSHVAGVSRSQHSDALGQTTSSAIYSTVSTQPPVFTADSQSVQGALPVNASGMIGGLPPNLPNGQLVQIQSPGSVPTRFLLVRANSNEMQPVPVPPLQMGMPRGIILPQNMVGGQPMPVMFPSSCQSRYPGPNAVQQSGMKTTEEHGNSAVKAMEAPKKQEFLRELSQSYRLLLRVFKYLSVKDLLVASRVCVMWRDLAYSSSLWGTVRLRNVCVKDWPQLARFMERRNVRNIDLRKMIFRHPVPEKVEHTLHRSEVSKSPSKEVVSTDLASSPSSCIQEKSPSKNGSPVSRLSDGKHISGLKKSPDGGESFRLLPQKDKLVKGQVSGETSADGSPVKDKENSFDPSLERRKSMEEVKTEMLEQKLQEKSDTAHETEEAMEVTEEEGDSRDDKETCKNERMEVDTDESVKKSKVSPQSPDSDRRPTGPVNESIEDDKQIVDANASRMKNTITRTEGGHRRIEKDIWDDICGAMGSIHCLRGVILPTCRAEVLQLLLTRCKHLTSVTATELREPSGISKFDPAYLMEVPHLEELRLGSTQNFLLTSNFNFIKLQKLKVLVMRGFSGSNWPYLGTNLTHLQVGPISNFSNLTWNNIGSMTNLEALWLEDGGSQSDISIFEALSRLSNLRRLCLFNFAVGPKLGQALKKLTKLERVFVLPVPSQQTNIGVQNGNMLAVTETMRHVDELVWAVRSQDIQLINQVEHIHMCPTKTKAYTGFASSDEAMANMWTLQRLETIVKRHLPRTRVRILKLDAAAAARMAMSTL